jgi:hypothetical protein
LHLLHCGVLRSPNTTTSHYKAFRVSSLAQRPASLRRSNRTCARRYTPTPNAGLSVICDS